MCQGITLTLLPLAPQEMRSALQARDFELAYHHWDFADDNYWLWPLFDPHPDALHVTRTATTTTTLLSILPSTRLAPQV